MKYLIFYILFLFLFVIPSNAKEKIGHTQSIDTLIKKIKSSASDDRRVAMNKLKIKLRTLNKEARQKIMIDLQNSFTKHHQGKEISRNRSGILSGSQQSRQNTQSGNQLIRPPIIPRGPQQHTPIRNTPLRYGHPGGHR
jgi:uncharacterized membrane protein